MRRDFASQALKQFWYSRLVEHGRLEIHNGRKTSVSKTDAALTSPCACTAACLATTAAALPIAALPTAALPTAVGCRAAAASFSFAALPGAQATTSAAARRATAAASPTADLPSAALPPTSAPVLGGVVLGVTRPGLSIRLPVVRRLGSVPLIALITARRLGHRHRNLVLEDTPHEPHADVQIFSEFSVVYVLSPSIVLRSVMWRDINTTTYCNRMVNAVGLVSPFGKPVCRWQHYL